MRPHKNRTKELATVTTTDLAEACYYLKRGNMLTGVECEVRYGRSQRFQMTFSGPHVLADCEELWTASDRVELFEIPDVLRHVEAFLPGGIVPPVETADMVAEPEFSWGGAQ